MSRLQPKSRQALLNELRRTVPQGTIQVAEVIEQDGLETRTYWRVTCHSFIGDLPHRIKLCAMGTGSTPAAALMAFRVDLKQQIEAAARARQQQQAPDPALARQQKKVGHTAPRLTHRD